MLKKVGCGIAVLTLLPLAYAAKPVKVVLVCEHQDPVLTGPVVSSISAQIDKIAPTFDFWTTTNLDTPSPLKGPVYTLVLTKMYEASSATLKQYGGTATNLGNLNWTMGSSECLDAADSLTEMGFATLVIGSFSQNRGTPGLVTYTGGPFQELAFNFHFNDTTPPLAIVDVNVLGYKWQTTGPEVNLVFEYRLLKNGVSLGTFTQPFSHFEGDLVDQSIGISPNQ